jgi:hypothetical protein
MALTRDNRRLDRAFWDRDNDYLTPGSWVLRDLREMLRSRLEQELVPLVLQAGRELSNRLGYNV